MFHAREEGLELVVLSVRSALVSFDVRGAASLLYLLNRPWFESAFLLFRGIMTQIVAVLIGLLFPVEETIVTGRIVGLVLFFI